MGNCYDALPKYITNNLLKLQQKRTKRRFVNVRDLPHLYGNVFDIG